MGEKLNGWILSVAGVWLTELDTDIIYIIDRLVPKQYLVGEIASRVCEILKEYRSIVVDPKCGQIENSIAGRHGDWDRITLAALRYHRGSKKGGDED